MSNLPPDNDPKQDENAELLPPPPEVRNESSIPALNTRESTAISPPSPRENNAPTPEFRSRTPSPTDSILAPTVKLETMRVPLNDELSDEERGELGGITTHTFEPLYGNFDSPGKSMLRRSSVLDYSQRVARGDEEEAFSPKLKSLSILQSRDTSALIYNSDTKGRTWWLNETTTAFPGYWRLFRFYLSSLYKNTTNKFKYIQYQGELTLINKACEDAVYNPEKELNDNDSDNGSVHSVHSTRSLRGMRGTHAFGRNRALSTDDPFEFLTKENDIITKAFYKVDQFLEKHIEFMWLCSAPVDDFLEHYYVARNTSCGLMCFKHNTRTKTYIDTCLYYFYCFFSLCFNTAKRRYIAMVAGDILDDMEMMASDPDAEPSESFAGDRFYVEYNNYILDTEDKNCFDRDDSKYILKKIVSQKYARKTRIPYPTTSFKQRNETCGQRYLKELQTWFCETNQHYNASLVLDQRRDALHNVLAELYAMSEFIKTTVDINDQLMFKVLMLFGNFMMLIGEYVWNTMLKHRYSFDL